MGTPGSRKLQRDGEYHATKSSNNLSSHGKGGFNRLKKKDATDPAETLQHNQMSGRSMNFKKSEFSTIKTHLEQQF